MIFDAVNLDGRLVFESIIRHSEAFYLGVKGLTEGGAAA